MDNWDALIDDCFRLLERACLGEDYAQLQNLRDRRVALTNADVHYYDPTPK